MHELALCRALLAQAERIAAAHGAHAVRRVELRVGPLSGAVPELLREAFAVARAGTCAQEAELVVHEGAIEVECEACGARGPAAAPNRLHCPACGGWRTRLVAGDELLIERVELALAPRACEEGAEHV